MNLDAFEVLRANVSGDKGYSALYREFLDEFEVPETYLDLMYGSKMARHFYTENELAEFRARWRKK